MNTKFDFYIAPLSEQCSLKELKALIILSKEQVKYKDQNGQTHISQAGDCLFIPRNKNDLYIENRFKIPHRYYYQDILPRCTWGDGINTLTAIMRNTSIKDIDEIKFLIHLNNLGMQVLHNWGFTETSFNVSNKKTSLEQQNTIEIARKILIRENFDVTLACYYGKEWRERQCIKLDNLQDKINKLCCEDIGNRLYI